MKLLYKLLIIFSTVLMFNSLGFAKEETLEDLASEINNIRKEITNLKSGNIEAAIRIDEALKELDQVMEFVNQRVQIGDLKGAIATLDFTEKTMADITASIPKEFKSEIIGDVKKEFSKEEMQKITEMTKGMNRNKQKKMRKLAKSMQETKDKGLDVLAIAININVIGIKTIDAQEIAKVVQTPTISKTVVSKTLNLSKEIKDQERFSFIIGRSPEDVDLALRQVEVIKSADPKKQRAFELEKYGKAAGLDMDTISKGINAIYSGDFQTEKQISMDIINKLSQNPNFKVEMPTADQFDVLMKQDIAAEKAINAILNSGINFKTGTKGSDVKALSKQVADILSAAGEDQNIIDKVVYRINRTEFEVWDNSEEVGALVKAELNGKEQVDAFFKLLADKNQNLMGATPDSLAEQAAEIQATLDGRMDDFIDAKYDRLIITKLTPAEKKELSQVYSEALSEQAEVASEAAAEAAIEATETGDLAKAYVEHVNKQYKDAQKKYQDLIDNKIYGAETNKAYREMGRLQAEATYVAPAILSGLRSTNEIPEDFKKDFASDVSSSVSETAQSTASDVSSSVSETAQSTASDVSSSVSETAQQVSESVAQDVTEVAQEAAQEAVQEVAQEVSEVAQEAAQEVAQEVAQTLDEQIADLQEVRDLAWAEYAAGGEHGAWFDAVVNLNAAKTVKGIRNIQGYEDYKKDEYPE